LTWSLKARTVVSEKRHGAIYSWAISILQNSFSGNKYKNKSVGCFSFSGVRDKLLRNEYNIHARSSWRTLLHSLYEQRPLPYNVAVNNLLQLYRSSNFCEVRAEEFSRRHLGRHRQLWVEGAVLYGRLWNKFISKGASVNLSYLCVLSWVNS
jgi:hypothetical protein